MAIDQDLRWDMLRQLNRHDHPGSRERLQQEATRDPSDTGQAAALAATVVRPDPQTKAQWLAAAQDLHTEMPFSKIRVVLDNLFPPGQSALAEASATQRLAGLGAMDRDAGPVTMRSYAASMIPAACTPASVARLQRAIAEGAGLSAGTARELRVAAQDDARCVAIAGAMSGRGSQSPPEMKQ